MSIRWNKTGLRSSRMFLNMADLALARGAEPEKKIQQGLMLDATSITPITEDIVTLTLMRRLIF